MDELRELLKGHEFGSLEEANAFISGHMRNRNESAIDDFQGLSSEQMHRFLYFPFDSPDLVTFPSRLASTPEAPIATLFTLLADGIGDHGLKATATGNLPRQFCRDAALAYMGEEKFRRFTKYGAISTEKDFHELHVVRLVAVQARLIRKYKGSFVLTKLCRNVLKEEGMAGIYPQLFSAFVREYNWGYSDRYQEIPMIQQSFLFTLYLLQKHGDQWQSSQFYEDALLQAFSMLLNEIEVDGQYFTPDKVLRSSYSLRSLERFAGFLGLVEIERDPADPLIGSFRVGKLPLLDEVVQLHL